MRMRKKTKKRSFLDSKYFSFMDTTYRLIKSSLLFWVYLFKHAIVLGFSISFCTLIDVVEEILGGNAQAIRQLFREKSKRYRNSKILSLLLIGLTIYFSAFVILPFPKGWSSAVVATIKFVCLYMLLLIWILFMYTSYTMVKLQLPAKQAALYGFYLMVKHFLRSFALLLVFLAIIWLSGYNAVFFLFFAPSIYVMCTRAIIGSIYRFDREQSSVFI
ncbi:hypothetical protein QT234_09540 [Geobacillus stearothermophilus]|uniref:hypothetical protein n=1 Tax=Geobacillus thermoleovorans group TaxID=1505648 RepID=UPI0010BEE670|nr:hypothetical protein [Geobacillus kaustophilus]MED4971852.1 hypothetical protein [Geobacillus thermoleovorans]QCK83062.1 hypothetical protein E5Z46_13125 [Geobacillus kaustophilus NBRC 102445]WJP98973.1 hypothetical protein QT234_09540 [Geobacillus stearothermophilus]WJQ02264.1 hypothetical protein QT236_09165 [Geobacillus stearothermophilus]